MEIKPLNHPSFINGRCASVKGWNENKEFPVIEGFFGEIHPEVITNFNLEYPVVAFEVTFKE